MNVYITQQGEALGRMISLLGAKSFPGLQMAVKRAANIVLREWVGAVKASGSKEGWKRKYMEAINIERNDGPMESTVSADGMYVDFVEKGVKRFDMKPGLLNGPNARLNENGEPYNIIPFRHGTPESRRSPMPFAIYQVAQKLDRGEIQRRYRVAGVKGGGKKEYTKGPARLGATAENLRKKGKDIYAGMVKTGGPRHTQYMTFRVVSKNSKGWIFPGVPASPIFKALSQKLEPKVKAMLQQGLAMDLEAGIDYMNSKSKGGSSKV